MTKPPLPLEWINKIFMRLHGRFGNAFFDKFRIGSLNSHGQDLGVENAKIVWSEELAGATPERIKAALLARYDYAPSCDDFKMNCIIKREIVDYKAIESKIDHAAGKQYAANVVSFVAENTKSKTDYRAWAKRIIANPKSYPEHSFKLAQEALEALEA